MNQGTLLGKPTNKEKLPIIEALRERKTLYLEEFLNMETQISNVINLSSRINEEPNIVNNEMMLLEIQSFHEVTFVIQALKQQKTVFLDLTLVSSGIAQRITDFLSGGACAADCEQACISKNVFVLAPNGVMLSQLVEQE